jgi:hypothetical protein
MMHNMMNEMKNTLKNTLKTNVVFALVLWMLPIHAAVITINTSQLIPASPSDGLCSLTEAIDAANNNVSSGAVAGECAAGELHPVVDVIEVQNDILPAHFFTAAELTIHDSLHFKGPSKELLSFTGIGLNRIFYIINIAAGAEFTFTDMTFSDSAIRIPFDDYGGAIWAQHFAGASLTLERVNFTGNNAERGGGALGLFGGSNNSTLIKNSYFSGNFVNANDEQTVTGGGAIFIGGSQTVTIENSTFVNNTATNLPGNNPLDDAAGGAILVRATGPGFVSTVDIIQSTFSDNIADGVGGALAFGGPAFASESSEVTIRHSTVVSNEADFNNDQTGNDSGGGGIYSSSTTAINLFNCIVAANSDLSDTPAQDMTGSVISAGYNLVGLNQRVTTAFPAGQPNVNDDWVGDASQLIIPFLAPLTDNGGPTPTRLPLSNSLALDNGRCNVLTADQRHQHNPQTLLRTFDQPGTPNALTGCDIGAVELGTVSNNPVPDALDDTYSLLEGAQLLITPAQGLLNNDIDDGQLWVTSAGTFNSSDDVGLVELLADGAFMFTPIDDDSNGETTFEYSISDRINRDSATVTLTIEPVNDAPSFDVNSNLLMGSLGQYLTLPWASNISAGPADENSQSLVFVTQIVSAPSGFFSGFPSIDASTGEISFELANDASGQAELSVTLRDDAGTANGGADTSSPVLLTIAASDIIFVNGFEPEN